MSEPIISDETMDLDEDSRTRGVGEENVQQETGENSNGIREEALFLRGVDNLSSREIKTYLDHYLKDEVISSDQRINQFFLQWVNDSSVTVVFDDADSSSKALTLLSENYDDVTNLPITEERKAKSFQLASKEQGNIASDDKPINEENGEEKNPELYIRAAFVSDRKEKNAKEKSRYYLLHGEPDRNLRRGRGGHRSFRGSSYRQRDNYGRRRPDIDDEPDLFADKLPSLRKDRSSNVDNAYDNEGSIRGNKRDNDDVDNGRWKSDKFHEINNDDDDLFPNFQPRGGRSRSPDRSRSPIRSRSRSPHNDRSLQDRIAPVRGSRSKRRKPRAHTLFD